MINRKEFISEMQEEMAIRKFVRHGIKTIYEKKLKQAKKEYLEEEVLRSMIHKLISEDASTAVASGVQHKSTGIVELDKVLKATIVQVEEEYKTLTTKEEQRDSFAAHFLATLDAALAPVDANRFAPGGKETDEEEETDEEASIEDRIKEAIMEVIGIEVDEEEEAKFLPARPQDEEEAKEETEKEEKTFQEVPGSNRTGRNFAERAWNNVETQIISSYEDLEDPEDADAYRDYIITNFKLYFRKFEQELSNNIDVPVGAKKVEQAEGV
tara:strand:+ start:4611 stop:5417 length:807 start_codon:yes stop_codon:yes gene_type:complete